MKTIQVLVSNDLATDQRVRRTCEVLRGLGHEVVLVGRLLPASPDMARPYQVRRYKLWFSKGGLFYANLNLRLFWHLLLSRADAIWSNDLDTLLPAFLVSKIKGVPLIYDTHEYFLGVPEIQGRWVKRVWAAMERFIFPRLQTVFTVNESIAALYQADYGIRPVVVRNIQDPPPSQLHLSRAELGLPEDTFLIINQGTGINVDRGMEELLEALPLVPEAVLVLVGSGDVLPQLKKLSAEREALRGKVIFVDRQPYERMLAYTRAADCGVSLDKDTNVNYRYSLPNKLFDYFHSGIPVICSDLVEVAGLVRHYQVGEVITSHQPEDLAQAILAVKSRGKGAYAQSLQVAAQELSWTSEKKKIEEVLGSVI